MLRCKQDTEIVHIRVSIGPRSTQTLVDIYILRNRGIKEEDKRKHTLLSGVRCFKVCSHGRIAAL